MKIYFVSIPMDPVFTSVQSVEKPSLRAQSLNDIRQVKLRLSGNSLRSDSSDS
jgi:hypothetical protein